MGFDEEGLSAQSDWTFVVRSGQEAHCVEGHLQLRARSDEHGADGFSNVSPFEMMLHNSTFLQKK
jgi:hypothetical protein